MSRRLDSSSHGRTGRYNHSQQNYNGHRSPHYCASMVHRELLNEVAHDYFWCAMPGRRHYWLRGELIWAAMVRAATVTAVACHLPERAHAPHALPNASACCWVSVVARRIMFFYQCLFGMILIGNEVPVAYIQRHFPSLCTFEGKGFFLIFCSTYMFASANTYYNDSGRGAIDYLNDMCALALFVKGVFCLLLWRGRYTCCPQCVQVLAPRPYHCAACYHCPSRVYPGYRNTSVLQRLHCVAATHVTD